MEFRLCPGAPPPACGTGEARPHLSLSRCDNSRGGTRAERRAVAAFVCMLGVHAAPGHGPRASLEIVVVVTRLAARSRKEVFQPHLPVRLPCYDLAPITGFTLGRSLRVTDFRRPIHRAMADARLLANPASRSRVADSDPN